jgi:hypothetical protein
VACKDYVSSHHVTCAIVSINQFRIHQSNALVLVLVLGFCYLRRRRGHIVDVKEHGPLHFVFLIGPEEVDLGDVLVLAELALMLGKEVSCSSPVGGTCGAILLVDEGVRVCQEETLTNQRQSFL